MKKRSITYEINSNTFIVQIITSYSSIVYIISKNGSFLKENFEKKGFSKRYRLKNEALRRKDVK